MATGPTDWKIGLNEADLRAGSWLILRGLLLALGTAGSICLFDRFYGLIALSLVWAPYVFFHPRQGLWISPGFVLVASLISPPESMGLLGSGYSPELVYWAIGVCILFAAMLLRYLYAGVQSNAQTGDGCEAIPPRGFSAFAIMSVVAAAVGVAHGYALQNVAKQFFGCVLLCAYFLFALRFAPRKEHMEQVINRLIFATVICCLVYFSTAYYQHFLELGFHKELVDLSAYAGGLSVLLIPRIIDEKIPLRIDRTFMLALFLFVVPVLTQFKRAVLACVICGFLAWGMRSASRRKRYIYLGTALLVFAIVLSTSVLNPFGAWFSKYAGWEGLFPEDVQSSYSVLLRAEEFRQVMDSFGGVPPVLGSGLGSTITWYDPLAQTYWDQETLDNGLLYLLAKMGIAGTAAFIWFVGPLGVAALRKSITGLHLGLFLLLVFHLLQMIADASFFYFVTAGWAGTSCGFLYILNKNSETQRALLAPGTV